MKQNEQEEVRTTIYLNKDTYKKVKILAIQKEITIKELIEKALDAYVQNN